MDMAIDVKNDTERTMQILRKVSTINNNSLSSIFEGESKESEDSVSNSASISPTNANKVKRVKPVQ